MQEPIEKDTLAETLGTYSAPVLFVGLALFWAIPSAIGLVGSITGGNSGSKTTQLDLNHKIVYAIGSAEGTRTCNGGKTKAYGNHSDPGDGKTNGGTFSAAPRGNEITDSMSPDERDAVFLVEINNALKSTDLSKMSKIEIANFADLLVQAHPEVSAQFAKTTGPDIVSRRVKSFHFNGVNESWTTVERLKTDQQRRFDRISECLGMK